MATVDRAQRGSAKAPWHGLRLVWQTVQSWMLRRRNRNALARLDDHMLRDIGLTRTSASQECEKPFWAD